MKNTLLYFLITFIHCVNVYAQCPPEDVLFLSQEEIDDFATTYPNCTQIEGDVEIGIFGISSDIDNLEPLDQITSIEGSLRIDSNGDLNNLNGLDSLNAIGGTLNIAYNDALVDLSGLGAVTDIGGDLRLQFNADLIDLNGLNNLQTIGGDFSFSNNNALNSLNGLQQLNSIGGELRLFSNNALTDLSGLEGLDLVDGNFIIQFNPAIERLNGLNNMSTIGGNCIIQFNAALITLAALENLTAIGGYLDIDNNAILTSLTGLDNIDHTSITDLRLFENSMLSICGVSSVCDYLENMGTYEIYNNASGCNTAGETGCLVATTQVQYSSFSMFPNPARHQIYLQLEEEIDAVQVRIISISGKVMHQQIIDNLGAAPTAFEVTSYPPGMYFLSVDGGQQLISKRFVKQ